MCKKKEAFEGQAAVVEDRRKRKKSGKGEGDIKGKERGTRRE